VIKADEVNFLDTKAKLIRSGGVLRKVVDGRKAAEGTEESFRKAEEEMRRFREEWDAREKRLRKRERIKSDSSSQPEHVS
jgi:Skp family chaperone for outer membrane proteins